MAKFLLIDPSLQDYQGHYFEYASRVLRAATARGFEPVLAANRRFRAVDASFRVRGAYRFAFWLASTEHDRWRRWKSLMGTVRTIVCGAFFRLYYSQAGRWCTMLCQRRQHPLPQLLRAGAGAWLVLPSLVACAILALRALCLVAWSVMPFRHVLVRLWTSLIAYGNRVVGEVVPWSERFARPVIAAFHPRGLLVQAAWRRVKLRRFVRDTHALLKQEPMATGDVALLSVVSPIELMAVTRLFVQHPDRMQGAWHLVFRHNLHGPDVEQPHHEDNRWLRNALRSFQQHAPPGKAFLYADTEELAAQYNALGIVPFRTLPVPVNREYFSLRRQATPQGPLCVAYIGDARREKGYGLLPRLVGDLWAKYVRTGRARFAIQSNFNTPVGQPEMVVARAQLQGWPEDRVKLITEPLCPEDYRRQLLAADILLLPYDGKTYYSRSSGILAEALTAGVPVVAAAGTWMAMQLTGPHWKYHQELRKRSRVVESRRVADSCWQIAGVARSRPMSRGKLRLGGRRFRVCRVTAPCDAGAMLISFREHTERCGQFVELQICQCAAKNRILKQQTFIVGGRNSLVSVLVRLQPRARRVQVCARNAYCNQPIELERIRFDFLNTAERLPHGAVGVILSDPAGLSAATEELIQHHAHYRATALEHAEDWSRRHNPERLVDEVLQAVSETVRPTDGDMPTVPASIHPVDRDVDARKAA